MAPVRTCWDSESESKSLKLITPSYIPWRLDIMQILVTVQTPALDVIGTGGGGWGGEPERAPP